MGNQNPLIWTNWSLDNTIAAENLIVTDAQSNSGTQSGLVEGGGVQDVILLLGNLTSGDFTLAMQCYIPAGKGGYFNVQGEIPAVGPLAGVFNSSNLYFNNGGGAAGIYEDGTTGETAPYPGRILVSSCILF